MPSAALIHAAVFTAGAVLGGGIAAAVTNKNKTTTAPVLVPPTPAAAPSRTPALVGMQAGKPHVSTELVAVASDLPVMKFGHPGLEFSLSEQLGVC